LSAHDAVDERLETLLTRYNEVTSLISQKFLLLDHLLTELEAKKQG